MKGAFPTGTVPDETTRFTPPGLAELTAVFPQLEIMEFVGQGGMGAVYKVRQRQLDRIVALKILPPQAAMGPDFAERFTREARALAKLNHPHIVTLYEFGVADGLFYFLMEYVDGVTLRQLLNTSRITSKEALAIVPQICEALQFAHDEGIVHRDIKPENILLDKKGRVKIADFGIAKIVADGLRETVAGTLTVQPSELTEAGSVLGTPQYMAPEQKAHPLDVDHRADIYSLGVVFYQMLTGELPAGRIEAPSRKVVIDVRLDEIVLRALEKKPELRFQQASDVKTMVETIAQTTAGTPKPSARFSRMAILGACWPIFSISAVACLFLSEPVRSPSAHVFPWWVIIANAIGLSAPFGTTILGWIAVSQIRNSSGRLRGLGLAVFDGLVFPLLLLDYLIWFFGLLIVFHTIAPPAAFGARANVALTVLLGAIVISALVDYAIFRMVWRVVAGGKSTPADRLRAGLVPALIATGSAVVAIYFVATIHSRRKPDVAPVEQAAQADLSKPHSAEILESPSLSFGPVIERIVKFDERPGGYNLETGDFIPYSPPAGMALTPATDLDWLKHFKINLLLDDSSRAAMAARRAEVATNSPVIFRCYSTITNEIINAFLAQFEKAHADFIATLSLKFGKGKVNDRTIATPDFDVLVSGFNLKNKNFPIPAALAKAWATEDADAARAAQFTILGRLGEALRRPIIPDELPDGFNFESLRIVYVKDQSEPLTLTEAESRGKLGGATSVRKLAASKSILKRAFPDDDQATARALTILIKPNCFVDEQLTRESRDAVMATVAAAGVQPRIDFVGGIAKQIDNSFWDLPATNIARKIAGELEAGRIRSGPVAIDLAPLTIPRFEPATYMVCSHFGNHPMGLLQIIGLTDDRKGVKIRYKIIGSAWKQAIPANNLSDNNDDTGKIPERVPHDKVENYVAQHRRDLHSLLAAFHASGDTNYLYEAATRFPDEAQVQWNVLIQDFFPMKRRQWLDAFKASSPANSLPYYFSAADYFNNDDTQAGLEDLAAASDKATFHDFTVEDQIDGEQLSRDTGGADKDPYIAGLAAAVDDDLYPETRLFRRLDRNLVALGRQRVTISDTDSALEALQTGISLARRLEEGEGSKFLMSQWDGILMERLCLAELNPNTAYDFLGGATPGKRLAELDHHMAYLRSLISEFGNTGTLKDLERMTDAEFQAYSQRQKIYGETEAMQFLRRGRAH